MSTLENTSNYAFFFIVGSPMYGLFVATFISVSLTTCGGVRLSQFWQCKDFVAAWSIHPSLLF